MIDDPRVAYLNARTAYEAALKITKAHARLISGVGEQITRNPSNFIEATIEGKTGGGLHTAWELSKWPTADDLRRDVLTLKAAFDACQAHWKSLPEDGRGGCALPPTAIGAV